MYEQGELSESGYEETMELVDQLEEESTGETGNKTSDNIQYSINTTESGLKYVKLDGNIFLREDGTEMSQSEAYNQLVGKEITLEDGDTITFVKNLLGRSVYNELFKKLPGYEPGIDVKAVSQSINRNIVETIMASSVQNRNEPQRHNHPGIVDFDQREVYLADDNAAYRLELCIANLTDGKKIAYVKRYIEKANAKIEQEIKKAETAVQNRLNQPSKGIIRNISKTVNEKFSISDQVSKQDVVSDLREILRRGGDPAELRRYVENMERSTETATETNSTDSQDAEAQEILNAAREQNISVDEYLRRNWEQYEYDGQLNPAARTALDQEKGNVQYSISSEELQDIQSIGRKSVNDFTTSDIAKTERFAQQYWNEMGVKSPFFRAWFGDWRANDQTEIQVANVKGDARGVQKNADTGWDIQVSGKVFDETRVHTESYNIAARKYLPYINSIVENAVLLDSYGLDPDKPKSYNSLMMHSLYAVADIGSGPEILKLYVEEMNDPNKEMTSKRAYQLQNIENYQLTGKSSQEIDSSISPVATGTIHTVADLFAAVKQYDAEFNPKPASKVVNEDGTPMPVYHGTSDQFTKFKHSELSSKEGSFFFAQNKEDAEGYTSNGRVMEVYVNLQNPIDYNDMPSYIYKFKDKKAQVDALRQLGYDGWMCDMDTGWGEVSAFNSNQIKSATDNIGTFDGSNPDIRYSISDDQTTEEGETTSEELPEDPRSGLPRKAQDYLKRTETKLINDIGEKLSVPRFARREYLRPIVQDNL